MQPRPTPRHHHRKAASVGLLTKLKPWKNQILAGTAGAAVLVGGIAYLATRPPPAPPKIIPANATQEQVREIAANLPAEKQEQFRAERRQMGEARRQQMQADMGKRAAEYAGLKTQTERDAFLDKQIDEFQTRMKEMEARRKQAAAEGRTPPGGPGGWGGGRPGGGPPGAQASGPGPGNDGGGGPGRGGPPSQERRDQGMRERLDHTTPAERAQRQQMMDAMRKRAEARGITMPGPGGGGPGGGGPRGGR